MALRRKEKQLNQADRAKTGQNAPQQAGLFDLRENREEFDADYPDYPEERPYRERHRVEVDSTGSYSSGNYSARNRSAGYYDAESRENGTAGGNLSEWPGLTVSPYGEEYDRPEQRIVRGNVPASRRGTAAGVKSFEEQPQASGRSSDRDSFSAEKEQKKKNTSAGRGQAGTSGRSREIRADLLAPYAASEYGSRETAQGQYGTRTARQQPRGNVRGGTRNTARQESRAGTRSTAGQESRAGTRSTAGQESRTGTRSTAGQESRAGTRSTAGQESRAGTRNTSGQGSRAGTRNAAGQESRGGSGKAAERRNRSDTARNTAQTRRRNDSYYPAGNLPENHSERDSERDAAAASAERRLRQRALARKKREQQLRRFYIRTGVIALSILALVVFLIVSALKNRNGETAGPAGQGTETAQADAGTAGAADGSDGSGVETAPGGTGTAETENTGTDTQPGESSPGTEAEGSQTQTPAEPGSDDTGAVTEPGTGDAAAGQETAEGSQAQTPGEPGNDDTGAVTETGTGDAAAGQETAEGGQAQTPGETGSDDTGAVTETGTADAAAGQETAEGGQAQTPAETGSDDTGAVTETGTGDTAAGQETGEGTGTAAGQEAVYHYEPETGTGTEEQRNYTRQDDWHLLIVNPWKNLPEGHTVETTMLLNGESVDSRCYNALVEMLSDCRTAGCTPIVCSSYRPHEKQITLYENQVNDLLSSGMPLEQAKKEAGTVVAVPGTSEHELGLAVDICDSKNQNLDDSQADTPTQKWLMEHCWDYGFILRYPVDKSEITGIIFEPWHYRYVGQEAAAEIHKRGICLEEYLTP